MLMNLTLRSKGKVKCEEINVILIIVIPFLIIYTLAKSNQDTEWINGELKSPSPIICQWNALLNSNAGKTSAKGEVNRSWAYA